MEYNTFLVYCCEKWLPVGDRAQGDDSKHDSHYKGLKNLVY